MSKVVQVDEARLQGVQGAVVELVKTVEGIGKLIDPAFEAAPLYERPEPIEGTVSALLTVAQTVKQLRKMVERTKKSADEGEEAKSIAERALSVNEELLKGRKPCKPCKATGKIKDDECGACCGEGFVDPE